MAELTAVAARPTDATDARIRDLAQAAGSDASDQDRARRAILDLLYRTGIHHDAIASYRVPGWLRDDVTDEVLEVLTTKVLDPTGAGFNLTRAVTGSGCGWFRQAARHAVMWKVRDLRHAAATVTPASSDVLELVGACYELPEDHELAEADRREAAVTAFTGTRHRLRKTARDRHLVTGVLATLAVPAAARPRDAATRARLLARLDADPKAATTTARILIDPPDEPATPAPAARILIDEPAPTSPAAPAAEPLAGLWSGYTTGELERLAQADTRFGYLVARDAVADRPVPPAKQVAALRARLTAHGPGGVAWRDHCAALVDALLDAECETTSAYAAQPAVAGPAPATPRTCPVTRQRRLDTLLARTAAWEGQTLGSTAVQVTTAVYRLAGHLLD